MTVSAFCNLSLVGCDIDRLLVGSRGIPQALCSPATGSLPQPRSRASDWLTVEGVSMGQASAADLSLRPVSTLPFGFVIPYGLVCLDHSNLRPIRSHHLVWQSEAIGCRHASLRRRRRAKRCGWTDSVHVLCQRSPRPGARPPWRVAARPGRPATRSAGSASKNPPSRGCRQVVTGADRCRHVGTAEGARGHVTPPAGSSDRDTYADRTVGTEVVQLVGGGKGEETYEGDRKIKRPFPPTTAPTPCWGRPAHPAAGRPLRAAGHRQAGWLGTGCRHGWSCSGIGWSSTNNIRTGFGGGISHFQSNQAIYLNRTTVN